MNMQRRVEKLEAAIAPGGWDQVHSIVKEEHQSEDDALALYGRDRIRPNDLVIMHHIVSPKLDDDGTLIPAPGGDVRLRRR